MPMPGTSNSYSNYGRSANWAAGQGRIDIQEQRIAAFQAERATVNAQKWSPNTFIFPLPWPNNQAASFVQGLVNDEKDIAWDDLGRRFSRQRDTATLKDEVESIWLERLKWPSALEGALRGFKSSVTKVGSPVGEDSDDGNSTASGLESWPSLMQAASQELKAAKGKHKPTFMLPARTLNILNDLEEHLEPLFTWLGGLPSDEYRQAHCKTITSIISAIADGIQLNEMTLPNLSEMTAMFSDATHYISLCDSRRLNLPLIRRSAYIYDVFSQGLILLVSCAVDKKSGSSNSSMSGWIHGSGLSEANPDARLTTGRRPGAADRVIECLRDELTTANRDSKNADDLGSGNLSTILDTQTPMNLNIVNNFTFLLNSSPLTNGQGPQSTSETSIREAAPETRARKRRRIDSIPSEMQEAAMTRNEGQQSSLSRDDLLALLPYNPESVTRDIDSHASSGLISPRELQRLSAASRSDTFQRWLKDETNASALLIHGPFERGDDASPLSFLCAALAQAYAAKERVVVLARFCEERADDASVLPALRGPSGVLIDIIGQLVLSRGIFPLLKLGFLSRKQRRKVAEHDFEALCQLFLRLVRQLRHHKLLVFCLIDSVSTHETREMERLLSTLREVVDSQRGNRRRPRTNLVFKLLVTDPVTTSWAWTYFDKNETIAMAEDDEGAADGGEGNFSLED